MDSLAGNRLPEVFVSVDGEADGPLPGPNSMLSLGAVAFFLVGATLGTFHVNLMPLAGSAPDSDTMKWWANHPQAWEACQADALEAPEAISRFCIWADSLPGRGVFSSYPAAAGYLFVYWYCMRFVGRWPFTFGALDLKTLAMVALRVPYCKAVKMNMPQERFGDQRHTHIAVDDAVEQGQLRCNLLRILRSK